TAEPIALAFRFFGFGAGGATASITFVTASIFSTETAFLIFRFGFANVAAEIAGFNFCVSLTIFLATAVGSIFSGFLTMFFATVVGCDFFDLRLTCFAETIGAVFFRLAGCACAAGFVFLTLIGFFATEIRFGLGRADFIFAAGAAILIFGGRCLVF
ncbi:MAG: hypothetical protein M3R11_07850, partial [Acidobacteriota bacterium]|nr:hypothetical protein [Acidobacteriota bacterium]